MSKIASKILLSISFAWMVIFPSMTAQGETVKVGVLLHLSGDLANFGIMQKNSLLIALEDNKDQFGKGKTLEPIFQDMPTLPEEARAAVENLITREQVPIIVGGISSASAWQAAMVAQSHKVPFLITGSTEDKITEQGWEYVFRLNPPLSEYGNGLLWFLSEVVKPKTIAFLRAKSFTGMLSSNEVMEYCKKAGYEIVLDHVYTDDTTDFVSILKEVEEKEPDVISMASFLNDAVLIMQQCRALDIKPLLYVGLGGGFTLAQFGERAADVSNYVFAVSVWNPSVPYPGSKKYYQKYLDLHGSRPDFHGAEIYAAMQVIADTLHRLDSTDPESFREALLTTDMKTIIGRVKFVSYGKKTQQNRLPTYLVQWIDGEMKTVWPPGQSCQKYIYPFPGWEDR